MKEPPFSLYRVENVITEESATRGDYASSDVTPTEGADLREALDALNSDCWDNIDERGDGTIIAYPADYAQNIRTGNYAAAELIIHARRPEWADRLMRCYRREGLAMTASERIRAAREALVDPRCPNCSGSHIEAASRATVYQGFRFEGDHLDFDAYESDDVEFDGPERFVCMDCFHDSKDSEDFRP